MSASQSVYTTQTVTLQKWQSVVQKISCSPLLSQIFGECFCCLERDKNIILAHPTFHFCFAVSSVYLVWKRLFVENLMSVIFEFLYSNKFYSIFNLFLLFSSLFSYFSVRFVVCLQAKKRIRFIFTAGRQNFPHVFVWESSEKKAQPMTDSSVDEKTRRVS